MLVLSRRNFAVGPTIIAVPPASRGVDLASSTRFFAFRLISSVTHGVRLCRLWWIDPYANVVASLNRLGWWKDEQERAESTAHLIAARDLALAGITTVRVDFEALRATPAVVIRRLADELGLVVTEAQVQAAADSVVKPADVPRDVDPHQRFIDQLMAEVTRNPADARPVFMLAQVYFHAGDFANARKWFARRLEMDSLASTKRSTGRCCGSRTRWRCSVNRGPMFRTPTCGLGSSDRPARSHSIALARRYATENRHRLGYLFAERAAEIPLPEDDMIVPHPDIYTWRAADQRRRFAHTTSASRPRRSRCARRLLARPDIPDGDRQGMASNRDVSVPTMLEAASSYPDVAGAQPHRRTTRQPRSPSAWSPERIELPPNRHSTRFCTAAPTCHGSDASW